MHSSQQGVAAMKRKPTHYLYVCRTCKKEIKQPISPVAEDTPIPTCCAGSRRDMAFKGAGLYV